MTESIDELIKNAIVENMSEVIGIIAEESQFELKDIIEAYGHDMDPNDVLDELEEAYLTMREKCRV